MGQIGLQYDLHLDQCKFTYTHSRAFDKHKDFDLIGAVDRDKRNGDIFFQTYGVPVYDSLTEALNNHNPVIVIIATTTKTHFAILSKVLQLSKPKVILCEKPLSYNFQEAQKMVNLCKDYNVNLYVNYMYRSDIGAIGVKNWLNSSSIKLEAKGVCWYSKGFIHNGSHFFNLLEFIIHFDDKSVLNFILL